MSNFCKCNCCLLFKRITIITKYNMKILILIYEIMLLGIKKEEEGLIFDWLKL